MRAARTAQTAQSAANILPIIRDVQAAARVEEAGAAPNFPACFLAVECPHLKTDGPCNTVRHCRIGWWSFDLRRLLAESAPTRAHPTHVAKGL